MTGKFDAFVTADQNLKYQQNLTGASVGVVVLAAKSNRLLDLLPLVPRLKEALETVTYSPQLKLGASRVNSAAFRRTSYYTWPSALMPQRIEI